MNGIANEGDEKYAYIWYDMVYGGVIQSSALSWTLIWVFDVLAKEGRKVCSLEGFDEGHVRCWRWIIEGVYDKRGNERAWSVVGVGTKADVKHL